MRIFFITIIALFILTKGGWSLPPCNYKTALQALPPRIFFEQTIDGPDQPVLVTRFLHNKVGIFGSEFARCYFNAFDPILIYNSTRLLGLLGWLYFIYNIIVKKHYLPLAALAIIPVLPFLTLDAAIVAYTHKIFAIIGLASFLFRASEKPSFQTGDEPESAKRKKIPRPQGP